MAAVSIRNLAKRYDDNEVMRDINLEIEDGEFVVFVGPSGCGKSTLLRMIAGLEEISDGDLDIGTRRMNDVPASKRGVAMVFQSYALYPHMSLYDNMAFGLKIAGKSKAEIDAAVQHAAKILHIDHLLDRKPRALSGGQRQRVALARALVHDPQLLLLDEPLGALDALTRIEMQALIESLWRERGFTALLVTHDVQEAIALADRVLLIEDGHVALDQRIELARPRSRGQAQFAALEEAILARVLRHPGSEAATEPSEDFFAPRGVHQVQWAV